ncbi:RNA polymerase sigma factor [Sphingobacterium sp. HJSM2_6]|uniref:RNA polymerase sigma factor n=1 Tax=Sphingobacterium sp. HJSM2_6 TaxID=3366264 RepID=UPI003BE1C9F4
MDEKDLLHYYKQTGNLDTLGKLYAPYMSLMYGVCYKYLQNTEESQDAVMQIFDELISKLRIHEVENFKSWLYIYTRNYCLMALRKKKNVRNVAIEDHLVELEYQPQEDQEHNWKEQDFEKLATCMSALSEEQGHCVRMFYLEQKCYKDIAELTGFELAKVKSYIQNGRRNLKICMEKK